MRVPEWIAVTYFAYVAAACIRRRRAVAAAAVTLGAIVAGAAHLAPPAVRDWAPLVYILGGYYLCAGLFDRPSARAEAWLLGWDRRLLGDPQALFARWPRTVLIYLDVVYVLCFLLVPAGFALLVLNGRRDLADRYWTIVMSAEFGAFAPLAFVQTRPPWALERAAPFRDRLVHRTATSFVRHFTIGVNTFPSGHAAGSLAVALAVVDALPAAGGVLFVLAVSICAASVVGRYHYVVDVVSGAALAVAIAAAVILFGLP